MPAQWQPLDIFGSAYQNIPETGLTQLSSEVLNCYINESNQTAKRPGLGLWSDLGTASPIDGNFWWETEEVLIVLSNKRVFQFDNPNGSPRELTGSTSFLKNVPATFTHDTVRAYLANGEKIVHFTKDGSLTNMADADAPDPCTHLAFVDQYIFGNLPNTGQWQISEVADGTAWRAVDIFTAESFPDKLLALHDALGELVLIGTKSVEYWENDGVSPFSVIRGATQPHGAASPYTFALLDEPARAHWFTNTRRLVEVGQEKRQPVMVSLPMNAVFDSLSDVHDARGFRCTIDGLPLYVLTFPNADRTFVYNYALKNWSEWSTWDTRLGRHRRWRGNNYAYAKAWNLHIVGDHSDGRLYTASSQYFSDAGSTIRLSRKSGFNDHGVPTLKRSYAVRLRLKRAQGNAEVAEPSFLLHWRDDSGEWGPYREGSLGASGDHDPYVEFRQLGSYYNRQWELVYTDNAGFDLLGAYELVDAVGLPSTSRSGGASSRNQRS